MSDFTYTPSVGTPLSLSPRTKRAEFGDGYLQRASDGINTNPQNWNLVFNNLSDTDADAIEAFLEGKAGVTKFTWTPPGKAEAAFICEKWQRTYIEGPLNNITMLFEEVFEIA